MKTWNRVTHARPCSICQHPDWCTYADNGAACCMRVQSEVPMRNGGWLHNATQPAPAAPSRHERAAPHHYDTPDFDAALWWQAARRVANVDKFEAWGAKLGLPIGSLDIMGACHVGEMLAFPMHDGDGHVCGIRTRHQDGSKKAITGSRAGVFMPTIQPDAEVVVCEGPTDAAAAMELGFWPIGRPSCQGQERHVVDTCKRLGIDRVTICADADGPGIAGAHKLADVMVASRITVRMVTAGGRKDLREWFKAGVSPETVKAVWSQAGWRK